MLPNLAILRIANSNLASIFISCILFIKFLISSNPCALSKIEETEMLKLRPQPPSFLRHGKKFYHHSRIQREEINLFSFENLINFLAQWIIINQQKTATMKVQITNQNWTGKTTMKPPLFSHALKLCFKSIEKTFKPHH